METVINIITLVLTITATLGFIIAVYASYLIITFNREHKKFISKHEIK
jgi:hypothetical protein